MVNTISCMSNGLGLNPNNDLVKEPRLRAPSFLSSEKGGIPVDANF